MLARLRVVGIGIIAAAVVIDAFAGPLARWRGFRARVLSDLDPLDPPGTALLAGVADVLGAIDAIAPARNRRGTVVDTVPAAREALRSNTTIPPAGDARIRAANETDLAGTSVRSSNIGVAGSPAEDSRLAL